MGSLAYALGGGLAGGGAGAAAVGAEATRAIVQQGLEQLRENYAAGRQQQQQAFQSAEAEKQRGFEKELKGEEMTARGGIATRQLASEEKRATEQRRTQVETAKIRAGAVVEAAGLRAGAANNKPVKPTAEWTPKNIPFPNAADPLNSHTATIMTHKSGLQLAQMEDGRWVPFTGDVNSIPKAATIGRAPAADVRLLLQHPEQSPQFLAHWRYLPPEWQSAEMQRYSARQHDYETRGRPIDQPATGGTVSPEEADDRNVNEGEGESDYGMYGARGHQPDDDAPAQ